MTGDRELMRAHIAALFTHDDAGRMLRVNEPGGGVAPRFFLGRTATGNECRVRHDLDAALARALEAACTSEEVGAAHVAPPAGSAIYERILERGAPVERVWAGPAFRFPTALPPSEGTIAITAENLDLLRPLLPAWLGDVPHSQPFVAFVVEGRAVSVCCSVRITAAAHEAGVETHPEFRGRGYAVPVVSAWAHAVRAGGAIPLYSTSWHNTASQAVARKLGLVRYGTDLHIT